MVIKNKHYEKWVATLPELQDKVIAITGSTSGTGLWTAITAIHKHAKALLLFNRPSEKATKALKLLEDEVKKANSETKIFQVDCDLMDFASVRHAAEEANKICEGLGGLNVLANNAGIMMFPDNRTKDGFDVQMQTNHMSHFLLTKLLFPSFDLALNNGGEVRISQHSAIARHYMKQVLVPKYFEKGPKGSLGGDDLSQSVKRYHQTKLANTVLTQVLNKKLAEHGYDTTKIKAVAAEPGVCESELGPSALNKRGFLRRIMVHIGVFFMSFAISTQSTPDGALPLCEACFGVDVDSGDYFMPHKGTIGHPMKTLSKGVLAPGGKAKDEQGTLDPTNQKLVWEKSEEVHGDFFEFAHKL